MTPQEFSATVKAKYPEYSDVDDMTLAKKIVAKYPEYANKVDFSTNNPTAQEATNQNNTPTPQEVANQNNTPTPQEAANQNNTPTPQEAAPTSFFQAIAPTTSANQNNGTDHWYPNGQELAEGISAPFRLASASVIKGGSNIGSGLADLLSTGDLRKVGADLTDRTNYLADIENKPVDGATVSNFIKGQLANPVNYIPGLGELALTSKAPAVVADAATQVANKATPIWDLIKSGASATANQLPRALGESVLNTSANAGYNALQGKAETPLDYVSQASFGTGAGAGLMAGTSAIGKLLNDVGETSIYKSIGVPKKTQNFAANPPDIQNLVDYNGRNLVPSAGGGLAGLTKNVNDELANQGNKIGNASEKLGDAGVTVNPDDVRNEAFARIDAQRLGGIVDGKTVRPDPSMTQSKIQNMKDAINEHIDDVKAQAGEIFDNDPERQETFKWLNNINPNAEDLRSQARQSVQSNVPFNIATKSKTMVQGLSGYDNLLNPKQADDQKEAYQMLSNIYKNKITDPDALKTALNSPNIMPLYTELNPDDRGSDFWSKLNSNYNALNPIHKDYVDAVGNYAKLAPWKQPLESATAREGNKQFIGMRELLPLAGIVGAHGSEAGMATGIGLAALLHATRGPGLGNMIRGVGQSMQPQSALGTLARQAVGYPILNTVADSVYNKSTR